MEPPRDLDMPLEHAISFEGPGQCLSEGPAACPIRVELELIDESIEAVAELHLAVTELGRTDDRSHREGPLSRQWLGVDGEPRLTLRPEHVLSVEILVEQDTLLDGSGQPNQQQRSRGRVGYDRKLWIEGESTLTASVGGFLQGSRYLMHDRDPLFTEEFRDLLRPAGVTAVKLPARSPNLNTYADRFVRSIRSECLSQIIPLGEEHLRQAVQEFTEHHHSERNHQGLENRLIEEPGERIGREPASIVRRERHGGIFNDYERAAV